MTGFLFLWQFAHFYGIYITFRKDYEKTEFKFIKNKFGVFTLVLGSLIGMAYLGYRSLGTFKNS